MDTLFPEGRGAPRGDARPSAVPNRIATLGLPPFAAPADRGAVLAAIGTAVELGFDGLLLGCPIATEGGYLADPARGAPWLGGSFADAWPAIGRAAAEGGVSLLVDLPVGAVASGSTLHHAAADAYDPPDRRAILDPRRPLDLGRASLAARADAIETHAALIGALVEAARAAGIAGVCLSGLARLSVGTARALLPAIRARVAQGVLIGDMRGAAGDLFDPSCAGALDLVIASSEWWDWRAGWMFAEIENLRRFAPVLLPIPAIDDAATGAVLGRAFGLAAALGHGWMVPLERMGDAASVEIARLNASATPGGGDAAFVLSPPDADILSVLRTATPDPREADAASLVLVNASPTHAVEIDPASLLPSIGFPFAAFAAPDAPPIRPGTPVALAPGETLVLVSARIARPKAGPLDPQGVIEASRTLPRLGLEDPQPAVDGGRFVVKRIAGETVTVGIDIIGDGHDQLAAAVQWRAPDAEEWSEARLAPFENDRWTGRFPLDRMGRYHYRIVAWCDLFGTFRDELGKKFNAGVDVTLEQREGRILVEQRLGADHDIVTALAAAAAASDPARVREILLDRATLAAMDDADPRPHLASTAEIPVDAERSGAGFAAWYEVFPRSMSDDAARHGTFRDVERHLPRIRAMGFDVLYFPPIHPIGWSNRKGPNNTLTPAPGDPGSPYAIGNADGGHDAIHPELGSFEDFHHLVAEAAAHGLEIAIDFAIQCSPDHPWLAEHKDWFHWRPDGTIRYAENPPKKYQDIVNVDFYTEGAVPGLWLELAQVVLFWCEHGVRLFRVDNPHTKAFPFWEWMIRAVRTRHPDAVFLAEAFTRPKVMARLAKIGFSQSYTYFTWRNTRAEITEYLTQLNEKPLSDCFRPHFFASTPDINPFFLHDSGRPGFLIRACLAATLSGLWGVYNGFELCEGTPLAAGREEFIDSEKYQIRVWDWDRPGNIVGEITQLNRIRRGNLALRTHLGVTFLPSDDPQVIFYEKANEDRSNVLWIAVSFDPRETRRSAIELPLWRQHLDDGATVALEDLVGETRFSLTGKYQTVALTPDRPYAIWRVIRGG